MWSVTIAIGISVNYSLRVSMTQSETLWSQTYSLWFGLVVALNVS